MTTEGARAELLRRVYEVNVKVNYNVDYRTDIDLYKTADLWQCAAGTGDCEDYAIAKLRDLRLLGIPAADLHLACCWTESNEYHAVLVVDIGDRSYMLDNRLDKVVPIEDLPTMRYVKHCIQHPGGSMVWKQWL